MTAALSLIYIAVGIGVLFRARRRGFSLRVTVLAVIWPVMVCILIGEKIFEASGL